MRSIKRNGINMGRQKQPVEMDLTSNLQDQERDEGNIGKGERSWDRYVCSSVSEGCQTLDNLLFMLPNAA